MDDEDGYASEKSKGSIETQLEKLEVYEEYTQAEKGAICPFLDEHCVKDPLRVVRQIEKLLFIYMFLGISIGIFFGWMIWG